MSKVLEENGVHTVISAIAMNGAPDLEIYRRDGDEHTVH